MAFLRMYFRTQPMHLRPPACAPPVPPSSWSKNGTRPSIDAAILIYPSTSVIVRQLRFEIDKHHLVQRMARRFCVIYWYSKTARDGSLCGVTVQQGLFGFLR